MASLNDTDDKSMFDRWVLRADIMKLSEIYLARRIAATAPYVSFQIDLRPGSPEVSSTRFERGPRGRKGWLIYSQRLGADPDDVASAWAALGTSAINDAVLIGAEEVSPAQLGYGAVYRWTGVRQAGGNLRNQSAPTLEVVGGFAQRLHRALVSAPSIEKLVQQALEVSARDGDIDWSSVRLWSRWMPDAVAGMTVTDVSAPKDGGLQLYGHWRIHPEWAGKRGWFVRRPFTTFVEEGPGGWWISRGEGGAFAEWLAERAAKDAPSAEDAMALEGM